MTREVSGRLHATLPPHPSADSIPDHPHPGPVRDNSRDHFAGVLSWAPIGIFRVRKDGTFLSANRYLADMLGYGSTSELAERNLERDVYFDPSQRRAILILVETRGTDLRTEVRWRKKDGTPIWVEVTGHTIDHPGETAMCLEGLAIDITDRKNLEGQLLRAQRMESIGTLAAGIAHDLNNVLAPITMSVAMLRSRVVDAPGTKWLNTIDDSVSRASGIVKQVLSFGRGIEGDRVALQPGDVIREGLRIMGETFPKSIDIQMSVPDDLWVIDADPTQMHQVLLNLCLNGRDAMPSGGVLKISAENVTLDEHYAKLNINAKPGRYFSFSVTDTGTGIAQQSLDRIFDPFFTTKPPGKGTGLGLSTSLGIIRSHGGFINVYTEPGRGTTFRVYLPAQAKSGSPLALPVERKRPPGHGELILVVDDEQAIREITKGMLEANGYAALTARNGSEALDMYRLRRGEIRATITDIMMPVMDGPGLIRELRNLDPSSVIIASSGLGSDRTREPESAPGATMFLRKPYTVESLLQSLNDVLHE